MAVSHYYNKARQLCWQVHPIYRFKQDINLSWKSVYLGASQKKLSMTDGISPNLEIPSRKVDKRFHYFFCFSVIVLYMSFFAMSALASNYSFPLHFSLRTVTRRQVR